MWTNPLFPADLVSFTEDICNTKFNFLYSVKSDDVSSNSLWNVMYWLFKSHNHESDYAFTDISFIVSFNMLATMLLSSFF